MSACMGHGSESQMYDRRYIRIRTWIPSPSVPAKKSSSMPSTTTEFSLPLRLARASYSAPKDVIPPLVPRGKPRPPQNPIPIPETPTFAPPPDPSTLRFSELERRILSKKDQELFRASPTYTLILAFIFSLSESIASKKISSVSISSSPPIVGHILCFLSAIDGIIKLCPPVDQGGSRFGNPSFRKFFDMIPVLSPSWHRTLGITNPSAIAEVSTYLYNSFGNPARIDYGSGHELNFFIWLLSLNRLSILPESSFPAIILLVFPKYLSVLRRLQITYFLEPAGSHGVWGMDDYHFLPFLYGASQLINHPYIRPLSIHNDLVLEEEGDEYLYLKMVRWTMSSKSVKNLRVTQPMLDDISGAKSWAKVEQGMRRMFLKEVLGKLPVMQHFLFGSLIPAVEGMSREKAGVGHDEINEQDGSTEGREVALHDHAGKVHVHRDAAWGECCGIKIPSTVAAAQARRKKGDGEVLRRVPFD